MSRPLSIHDYEILETLGEGSYGLVKLAVKKNDLTQTKVVIKYVVKSLILVDSWIRDRKLGATIPAEIHILNTLKSQPHENIGEMLGYFEDDDHYYIVMSLHGQIDLYDFIEANKVIPEREIKRMFRQVALGVRHLHDRNIVHRDIKDENVVLDQFGECLKLIDFGSAAYLRPGKQYEACCVGTLEYAAPEILHGHTYAGKPQDIWALGILLFTLIYRENPFYDINEIMDYERAIKWPYILSKGSGDLMSRMLQRDVEKRIDIHGVLAHPWLMSR
ncbi:kinase-like domain-containing protein [Mycotypha africana]|uniref:kinase-like domain-containing protein n=1 Tax=Mycotypha africana TaxID=64632 RepID=UPI0023017DA1|nr:kinase-like domain-containing protein [Mycotypha africana]KAI8975599.1 kinase-like domain-containing protein [Mycotypha africana]